MTNLKELVFSQIEKLGEKEAAEKFGKSVATIKLWRATGNIPLPVVQMVLSEQPEPKVEPLPPLTIDTPDPVPNFDQSPQTIIDSVMERLDKLEEFARAMTDPDLKRLNISAVRPVQAIGRQYVPEDNRAIRPGPAAIGPMMSGVSQDAPFTPATGKTAMVDTENPSDAGLPQTYGVDWNKPYDKSYRK